MSERIRTGFTSEYNSECKELWSPQEALWQGIQELGGAVNTHTHLDRAGTITPDNFHLVNSHLHDKWSIIDEIKACSTEDEIYDRMVAVTSNLREEGTKVIGSFIDVDAVVGCKALRAADRLRKTFDGEIDFVFANQTLKGVMDKEAREYFLEGADWADIVGGLPGKDSPHEEEHVEFVLETAKQLGKMAHIHVDQLDTPSERETELLARKPIEAGMHGRVVAVHAISLAAHPIEYREQVYKLMEEAGLMVISCPKAWINSRRSEKLTVTHNAMTPIDEMHNYGIISAIGSDNIADVYMPYNTGSMREEVNWLCEGVHLYDTDKLALIATINGKIVLGLEPKEKYYD